MINVEFRQIGNEMTVEVIGHANYGPHGQDIVCAGISLLTAMLNELLIENAVQTYRNSMDPGCARFWFDSLNIKDKVMVIYKGFAMMAMNYPDYVCLSSYL